MTREAFRKSVISPADPKLSTHLETSLSQLYYKYLSILTPSYRDRERKSDVTSALRLGNEMSSWKPIPWA